MHTDYIGLDVPASEEMDAQRLLTENTAIA